MSHKVHYEFIFFHNLTGDAQADPSKSGSAFFSRLPCKGEYVSIWVNKDECYSGNVIEVLHSVKDCGYPNENTEDERVYTRIMIEQDSYENLKTIEE